MAKAKKALDKAVRDEQRVEKEKKPPRAKDEEEEKEDGESKDDEDNSLTETKSGGLDDNSNESKIERVDTETKEDRDDSVDGPLLRVVPAPIGVGDSESKSELESKDDLGNETSAEVHLVPVEEDTESKSKTDEEKETSQKMIQAKEEEVQKEEEEQKEEEDDVENVPALPVSVLEKEETARLSPSFTLQKKIKYTDTQLGGNEGSCGRSCQGRERSNQIRS